MGKSTCFAAASGIKRGPWTPEEDRKLLDFIQLHGHGSWSSLPQKAGTYYFLLHYILYANLVWTHNILNLVCFYRFEKMREEL